MAKFVIYEDKGGQWRWKMISSNGQSIANGGEGFSSKTAVTDSVDRVKAQAADSEVVEEETKE